MVNKSFFKKCRILIKSGNENTVIKLLEKVDWSHEYREGPIAGLYLYSHHYERLTLMEFILRKFRIRLTEMEIIKSINLARDMGNKDLIDILEKKYLINID